MMDRGCVRCDASTLAACALLELLVACLKEAVETASDVEAGCGSLAKAVVRAVAIAVAGVPEGHEGYNLEQVAGAKDLEEAAAVFAGFVVV